MERSKASPVYASRVCVGLKSRVGGSNGGSSGSKSTYPAMNDAHSYMSYSSENGTLVGRIVVLTNFFTPNSLMAIIHGSRRFGYRAENWLKNELMYSKHSSSLVVVDLYEAGAVATALRRAAALRALVLSRPSAVNTPAFIFSQLRNLCLTCAPNYRPKTEGRCAGA